MVNMGNDGDIAYRLGHREFFPFLFRPPFRVKEAMRLGGATVASCHTARQFLFYRQRYASGFSTPGSRFNHAMRGSAGGNSRPGTTLSSHRFQSNEVRLRLSILAHNLAGSQRGSLTTGLAHNLENLCRRKWLGVFLRRQATRGQKRIVRSFLRNRWLFRCKCSFDLAICLRGVQFHRTGAETGRARLILKEI